MSTIHHMVAPLAEVAEDAMSVLESKGLSPEKAEELRGLVSMKVQEVYDRLASVEGVDGEREEIWEDVNPDAPEILQVADEFIAAEGLTEQADLVVAIRDFVRAQAVFRQAFGYYNSPLMDLDGGYVDDDDDYPSMGGGHPDDDDDYPSMG